MRKSFVLLIAIIISILFIPSGFAYSDTIDAPDIEWDDRYSTGYSSQKITMTAEVPDDASKIKFYLFANDKVTTRTRTISKNSKEEIKETFYSLDQEQEVWGYIIAYDKYGDEYARSEWASEYIGRRGDYSSVIKTPDAPEVEWITPDRTNNSQKVTVRAEMPRDAKYLQFFLICDGNVKSSGKTKNETHTFTSIDYDQTVIAYVKAYDSDGYYNDSYRYRSDQSATTTLYIGDDGQVITPDIPTIRWIDQGQNSPYGQRIVMTGTIPRGAKYIRYFLIANGTMLSSEPTTSTSHGFYHIQDNQSVIGFVRAYDRWDNVSQDSSHVMAFIPNRTSQPANPNSQNGNSSGNQNIENRILNKNKGISIKDFELPNISLDSSFYFEDISKNDTELREALQYFYSTRVLENSYNNKFYPEAIISRIEFLNALLKLSGNTGETGSLNSHYTDIKSNYPYLNVVLNASRDNIMVGYRDYTFRPADPLTYGVAAKAISNAFNIRLYNTNGERLIDDIEQHYMDALSRANIIKNKPYSKDTNITRAEAIKMLYRIVKIKIGN